MEKIIRTKHFVIILLLSLGLFGCNVDTHKPLPVQKGIASYSDLYDTTFTLLEYSNYNTKSEIANIVVHCTASYRDLSKEWLLNFFKYERGWSKPGYHFIIHKNGLIDTLVYLNNDNILSYDEIAYGARGHNHNSIHISYTGGVDKNLKPKDTRTSEQKQSIKLLLEFFKCRYPNIKIWGHRDLPNVHKACPSFNVHKQYPELFPFISQSELFDTKLDSI